MKNNTHTYSIQVNDLKLKLGDFELEQEGMTTLICSFTYSPGTPDVWYMPNGDPGYPGDPAELEITAVRTHNSLVLCTASPGAKLLIEANEDISRLITEDDMVKLEERLMEKPDLIPQEPDYEPEDL